MENFEWKTPNFIIIIIVIVIQLQLTMAKSDIKTVGFFPKHVERTDFRQIPFEKFYIVENSLQIFTNSLWIIFKFLHKFVWSSKLFKFQLHFYANFW